MLLTNYFNYDLAFTLNFEGGVNLLNATQIAQVQTNRGNTNTYCFSGSPEVSFTGSYLVQSLLEPRYYSMSGKYSIECWVKFNNFNPQGIFSYNRYLSTDTEVRENGFSLRVKNSKFNFKVGYWSKREVESVPLVNIVSGNWFHLVVMVNDYSPEPVVITWPRCRTLL